MQENSIPTRADRPIPVKLPNGATMYVEATRFGADTEVLGVLPEFKDLTRTIEGIADAVKQSIERARPTRTTVELGLEVAVEAGKLTALLVKGSGSASLHVTLEWDDAATPTPAPAPGTGAHAPAAPGTGVP